MEGAKPSSVALSVEGGFDLMVSPPAKTITSLIPLSQEMLEEFLASSSCDKDVISHVERRAHTILQAIFPDEREEDLLRYKSLRLYYIVLEVVCRGKGAETLYAILTDERFHRCMLACAASVEILLITVSSTETKLFPAEVLERSGITAFDLSNTIIESFIRHEESLPGQFRRHLNSFKEQLLESMVWKKGSSLYNSLQVARPSLSAEINRLGLFAEPMPSVAEIATHINSSCGGGLPPVPSLPKLELETSPSKGGGGETCAETEINNFFREIIMLGAVRIHGMVERLLLSQQTRENIYCLFQRILNEQTSIFFNRHIDQIILCCFYGVAKLSKLNLTFREIIHSYKEQPQCRPHVYHRVFVDWPLARHGGASTSRTGQEHVDMITFYNDIFIPSVRPLVLELGAGGATVKSDQIAEVDNRNDGLLAQCLGSPKILPFPRLPNMSREKVYGTHNLRISPLRSSEIIMLGAVRINGMVEKLQLSQQIGEKVYCLFQRILNQLSFLFFDFHIDQIILCCFHGVAKDLTFGEIIESYRRQPQYEPPVFLSEFVNWPLACRYWPYEKRIGQAHVNAIVKFYTDIFIPDVKPLLSELGSGGTTVKSDQIAEFNNENDGQSPGSPKILPFPSLPVMSPEEVSATHYVCVSPLGSSEIIMLGAVRISSMVEMLQLSQQMRENVYCLFQRILHQQTSLFFNRHIDQIIPCCFCGVAKISKLNLTFGEIINSYKKQPQCKPRVFDSVFVDWSLACQDWAFNKRTGQEHVDIVTFYNDIFFPSVKPLLLELGAGEATVKSDRKAISTGLPSIWLNVPGLLSKFCRYQSIWHFWSINRTEVDSTQQMLALLS